MNDVIAAVDFSKSTDSVLEEAARYSVALDAKLLILHVASDESRTMVYETSQFTDYAPELISIPGDVQLARDISADEMRREHSQLLGMSAALRGKGIDARAMLLKGDAAKLVLEKAEGINAELIVLGSHGHGLLRKALLGSVSEAIIRHAHCNVLVVPSRNDLSA